MRVTKAIREYVEETIKEKYRIKIDEIGKDYQQARDDVEAELNKILAEANEKAKNYLNDVNFDCVDYRVSCNPFGRRGRVCQPEMEDINAKERSSWMAKCEAKVKQVLFDLEMGETAKNELKDLLDKIEVD